MTKMAYPTGFLPPGQTTVSNISNIDLDFSKFKRQEIESQQFGRIAISSWCNRNGGGGIIFLIKT